MDEFSPVLWTKVGSVLFVLFAVLCIPLKGESPDKVSVPRTDSNLRFTAEVYALKKDAADRLMKETGVGPDRYDRVKELIKSGNARFETLMAGVAQPGQRSMLEQVDEVRYPTEFNQPAADRLFLPKKYETQNAGETLGYEAVLGNDSGLCKLDVHFSAVRFNGFYEPNDQPQGNPCWQPLFESRKMKTHQELWLGDMNFLVAFNRSSTTDLTEIEPGQEEKMDVRWVFGRLDLQELAQPSQKPAPVAVDARVEIYSMERSEAQRILSIKGSSAECYAAVKKRAGENQAWLEPGTATSCSVKPGERVAFQLGKEKMYPSEYAVKVNPGDAQAFESSAQQAGKAVVVGYPCAFGTHNTGFSMEMEFLWMPNGLIQLSVTPQLMDDLGSLDVDGAPFPAPALFGTRKITTSLMVAPGEPTLVGTLNPPGADGVNDREDTGLVWLCFVQVNPAKPK